MVIQIENIKKLLVELNRRTVLLKLYIYRIFILFKLLVG